MAKNDTQGAPSAVERLESEGRRNFLRTGAAAVAAAAALGMPIDADAQLTPDQQRAKEKLDAFIRNQKAAANPPAPAPAPPAAQRPAAPQNIAPQTLPPGTAGVDLENDAAFKQFSPAGYAAYQTMSALMVGTQEAAFKPMPSRKELDQMSHTDRERLINAREREITAEQKTRDQSMKDFSTLYYQNTTPPQLEGKKKAFEDAISAVNALNAGLQAEVLGRLVRDVKETNDTGSRQSQTLTLARALFNIFPQAKTVTVKYRSRPLLGASNSQSNAFDYDAPVAGLRLKSGSVTEYLSENSVMMTKLARDETATAHGMEKSAVEGMLARNNNQRGAGRV